MYFDINLVKFYLSNKFSEFSSFLRSISTKNFCLILSLLFITPLILSSINFTYIFLIFFALNIIANISIQAANLAANQKKQIFLANLLRITKQDDENLTLTKKFLIESKKEIFDKDFLDKELLEEIILMDNENLLKFFLDNMPYSILNKDISFEKIHIKNFSILKDIINLHINLVSEKLKENFVKTTNKYSNFEHMTIFAIKKAKLKSLVCLKNFADKLKNNPQSQEINDVISKYLTHIKTLLA